MIYEGEELIKLLGEAADSLDSEGWHHLGDACRDASELIRKQDIAVRALETIAKPLPGKFNAAWLRRAEALHALTLIEHHSA